MIVTRNLGGCAKITIAVKLGCLFVAAAIVAVVGSHVRWKHSMMRGTAPDAQAMAYVNGRMSALGLPALPSSARGIHVYYGGLFGKYLYLRFQVGQEGAREFFGGLGAQPAVTIGDGPGDVRVLSLDQEARMFGAGRMPPEPHLRVIPPASTPWYEPHTIRHGQAYERFDAKEPIRLQLFYDQDTETVFLSWQYS